MTGVHRTRFGDVFVVAEFRALWLAQALSLVGDQLARVALSVLVYGRTGSPLLTGLVYALSFLPAIVGGPLLAGLADRLPRRLLMIRCDVARAVLVAAMVLPGVSLPLLCVLLVAVELLGAPSNAARAALLPEVFPDDRYVVASAVGNITGQCAQVLGFIAGGSLAALLGPSRTLLVDAATFLASALLLAVGVRERPAPRSAAGRSAEETLSPLGSFLTGTRLVFGNRRLRALVALAWLCGFYVVPEGLAAPYAASLGGHAATVGLLLAAQPAGAVLGALVLARLVSPDRRLRLVGPMAVLSCLPLLGCATNPGTEVTLVLWALSGVGTAYQLAANAAFVAAVPDTGRGQAFGLVQSGIVAVQGVAILAAGAAALTVAPSTVVAAAGGLGAAAAAVVWQRRRRPSRSAAAGRTEGAAAVGS